jgi:hypothetical protein
VRRLQLASSQKGQIGHLIVEFLPANCDRWLPEAEKTWNPFETRVAANCSIVMSIYSWICVINWWWWTTRQITLTRVEYRLLALLVGHA